MHAQAIEPVPYADLQSTLQARITFDTLPRQPEPGFKFDAAMRLGRAWMGQHFDGQSRHNRGGFDHVTGTPDAPLRVQPGARGQNLSVAYHQGFESNALFPLGPAGFPSLSARGEGAVALLFDQGQHALALKVHSDYVSPLGRAPEPGQVFLTLYTRQGMVIARHTRPLRPGITQIGLRRANGLPDIAGVLITNDDPGGIAIDDILYQTAPAAF
ncbi:hypothetical protein [Roseovarius sp. MMSF_3281]|uniref:hypothetical protein n=1 Tax=Roseovarius sp. MMSF_3281 TaxID=3046694 RepID=UPI00273EAB11|nr:hypothetical protein [Roseovarius sp. MMSF_3281]